MTVLLQTESFINLLEAGSWGIFLVLFVYSTMMSNLVLRSKQISFEFFSFTRGVMQNETLLHFYFPCTLMTSNMISLTVCQLKNISLFCFLCMQTTRFNCLSLRRVFKIFRLFAYLLWKLFYSGRRKLSKRMKFSYNKQRVEHINSFNYLGVTLSYNRNLTQPKRYLLNKVAKVWLVYLKHLRIFFGILSRN